MEEISLWLLGDLGLQGKMRHHIIRFNCDRDSVNFFGPRLSAHRTEHLLVAHLDGDRRLLATSEAQSPYVDAIVLPLRRILKDALMHESAAMVLAHNHPSGDATPSGADVAATKALCNLLSPIGIQLLDHLILGSRGEQASFRKLGWL